MSHLLRDLRHTLRSLRHAPAHVALVVLTLSLGLGATIAIFTLFDAILLRPLPYPDPDRLVVLCETHESMAGICSASPPNARDWWETTGAFESLGVARNHSYLLQDEEGPRRVRAIMASPGFLNAFRIRPQLGRSLQEQDLQPGSPRVALLSHRTWQEEHGGDPGVLGRALILDGEPHTLVGVLPADVEVPVVATGSIWTPLRFLGEEHRSWRGFKAVARRRAGITLAQARERLEASARTLAERYPESNLGWGVEPRPLHEVVVGSTREPLGIFLAAGVLLLLIGCANATNLMLVRALRRDQEMAVRSALGAGARDLSRLLVSESLVLTLVAGLLGLGLAALATRVIVASAPPSIPRLEEVEIHGGIVAFTLGLTFLTGLAAGLLPALRVRRPSWSRMLQGGARTVSERSTDLLRKGLVVGEIALAVTLLVGAGLLVRSFLSAHAWTGGFDRAGIYLASLQLPEELASEDRGLIQAVEEALDELRALPGVLAAGASTAGPLFGSRETGEFHLLGSPGAPEPRAARWFQVTPEYFDTLGLPLLEGRGLEPQDRLDRPMVALVNETFALRLGPDSGVVGRRLRSEWDFELEIVGVVADVPPLWPALEVEPEIYWPFAQDPRLSVFVTARTDPGLPGVAEQLRQRLRQARPEASLSRVAAYQEFVQARLVRPRFNTMLLGIFAAVALLLALAGTFGLMAYEVARRRREIGLRMALGARRGTVLRNVLSRGLGLAGLGLLLGLGGALALSRSLSSLLYQTGSRDPLTLTAVVLLLATTSLLALGLPAWRAASVEPAEAMRES